jgi:hypothetical protein
LAGLLGIDAPVALAGTAVNVDDRRWAGDLGLRCGVLSGSRLVDTHPGTSRDLLLKHKLDTSPEPGAVDVSWLRRSDFWSTPDVVLDAACSAVQDLAACLVILGDVGSVLRLTAALAAALR